MLVQAAQAVFLPHPRNCEGVSHPVGLWKKGSVNAFNGPILERMVYIGMSRYVFSCTKATQSSDRPRDSKHLTANTTTSLSTVRTYAFVWPCSAACARCRRILVSASEWLHGRSVVTWSVREHSLKSGTRRSFPPISFLDICVLMNENSYFLFFSFLRKPWFQSCFGSLVLPLPILVLDPFPRRFSVRALMFFSSG